MNTRKNIQKFWNKTMESYLKTVMNPSKESVYRTLCLARATAVRLIAEYVKIQESKKRFQKIVNHFSKQKNFNKTVSVVNPYQEAEKRYRDTIAELGGLFFTMLDEWQKYGASTAELRTFCNGCGSAWFKRISDSGTEFSSVVGAGYADYKETGDWLETIPEAPLSVCLREFFLYSILHTEHGKAAAKFALHSTFPELKDSFLYRCIDEDGNEFFVNQEGEVIS